jgi:ferric-dicitrate binding protein FerR (iron transport regulator)
MSEHLEEREMSDLELITRFLNGQLDEESDAAVRRRLDNDDAFMDLAAPLLFVWSIPAEWKANPRPADEDERMRKEFAKRAGFVSQRREARRRRLWILGLILLGLGIGALARKDDIRDRYDQLTRFEPVADSAREMKLRDGSFVTLHPGAQLRAATQLESDVIERLFVGLRGSARFRVDQRVKNGAAIPHALSVSTAGALVATVGALFDVTERGDTTFVEVASRKRPQGDTTSSLGAPAELPEVVIIGNRNTPHNELAIKSGELAMVVRGQKPLVVRAVADKLQSPPRPPRVATVVPSGSKQTTATADKLESLSVKLPSPQVVQSTTSFPPGVATLPGGIRQQKLISAWETHATEMLPEIFKLIDGTRVHLGPSSILRAPAQADSGQTLMVQLEGIARFTMPPSKTSMSAWPMSVQTPQATFLTMSADYSIWTRGDTVELRVFTRERKPWPDGVMPPPSWVNMSGTNRLLNIVKVREGQRARSVDGGVPVILPPDSARARP